MKRFALPPGTRTAIHEAVQALLLIAPDPLGRAQSALHNSKAKKLSTIYRRTGLMVIVHLTSRENRLLDTISFSVLRWTTTYFNFTARAALPLL